MNIRFLRREEIDRQLYNSCVHYATNGSIYGYDWFLNNTAREWDVLVEDDNYTSVMPLPRVKNWWGRVKLGQPPLVPELAVYTVNALSKKRIQSFWDAIPDEYRGGSLTVEPASVPADSGRFTITAAEGTPLLLNQPYETIIDELGSDFLRQRQLAEDADLIPAYPIKPEELAAFWKEQQASSNANESNFHAMQRLMYQVMHRGWGNGYAVRNRDKEVLAAAFYVYSHNRVFPLFTAESAAGRAVGARALLWDNFMAHHAERQLKVKREALAF